MAAGLFDETKRRREQMRVTKEPVLNAIRDTLDRRGNQEANDPSSTASPRLSGLISAKNFLPTTVSRGNSTASRKKGAGGVDNSGLTSAVSSAVPVRRSQPLRLSVAKKSRVEQPEADDEDLIDVSGEEDDDDYRVNNENWSPGDVRAVL